MLTGWGTVPIIVEKYTDGCYSLSSVQLIYTKDCTNNILTINKLRIMDIGQALFIEINIKVIQTNLSNKSNNFFLLSICFIPPKESYSLLYIGKYNIHRPNKCSARQIFLRTEGKDHSQKRIFCTTQPLIEASIMVVCFFQRLGLKYSVNS
ncbi:uncharacterized protein LOC103315393 isoform X2 [Nasonia vitripennis]|uniref:Uncharacterized protein n=1 Tax=Nasonia vitripennis TaxID=7425 RepID=A0A7M7ISJ3_NASVI|nr:uncharacterized protein LOC103315393 isoform X2 [Nasonia vitripennis]